jgi:hypothetical protein
MQAKNPTLVTTTTTTTQDALLYSDRQSGAAKMQLPYHAQ